MPGFDKRNNKGVDLGYSEAIFTGRERTEPQDIDDMQPQSNAEQDWAAPVDSRLQPQVYQPNYQFGFDQGRDDDAEYNKMLKEELGSGSRSKVGSFASATRVQKKSFGSGHKDRKSFGSTVDRQPSSGSGRAGQSFGSGGDKRGMGSGSQQRSMGSGRGERRALGSGRDERRMKRTQIIEPLIQTPIIEEHPFEDDQYSKSKYDCLSKMNRQQKLTAVCSLLLVLSIVILCCSISGNSSSEVKHKKVPSYTTGKNYVYIKPTDDHYLGSYYVKPVHDVVAYHNNDNYSYRQDTYNAGVNDQKHYQTYHNAYYYNSFFKDSFGSPSQRAGANAYDQSHEHDKNKDKAYLQPKYTQTKGKGGDNYGTGYNNFGYMGNGKTGGLYGGYNPNKYHAKTHGKGDDYGTGYNNFGYTGSGYTGGYSGGYKDTYVSKWKGIGNAN